MSGTRTRKIRRDIMARKGRTALVVLSILIGVFGVTTMISATDIINRQLTADLRPEAISHTHVYLRSTGEPISAQANQSDFERIRALDGVTDVEGQAVYPAAWRLASAAASDGFKQGYLVAFSEPFGEADLEPIARLTGGRYPQTGHNEIAVEQRFADAHHVGIGDSLAFPVVGSASGEVTLWQVVGTVIHPYFTIDPAIQADIAPSEAIYATYEDAQRILEFPGLTAIHVRYTSTAAAEAAQPALLAIIAQETPYVHVYSFHDDPENNYIFEIIHQVNLSLSGLGILSMIVSAFLVTNMMNTIIIEQRAQIGAMKSLGATFWDALLIYTGVALAYGAIGTLFGILLAIPAAAAMAQVIAQQAFTYIDDMQLSALGIGVGLMMGLGVPVLASLIPVLKGVRVSILEAMTDLGISSRWGQTRASRLIGSLPLPRVAVQAISHIYVQKGRLLLTGITLTLAAAAFMGVTAVDTSLGDFVDSLYASYTYEIAITPQEAIDFDSTAALITARVPAVRAVYPGSSAAVSLSPADTPDQAAESEEVTVIGINPATPTLVFDLIEGTGWRDDPQRQGIVVSRSLAERYGVDGTGSDSLRMVVGGQTYLYPVIGVDSFVFDALYMNWRELARISGYVDPQGEPMVGVLYVDLNGTPSPADAEIAIESIGATLREANITATFTNQSQVAADHADQVSMFGVMFNATSALMGAVGAVGLMAVLSMAVFERQKEIGVMRAIGAGSLTIMSQFLLEGVLIGLLAWAAAIPLSVGLGLTLMDVLPFDYLSFTYPPQVIVWGLTGIVLIAAVASAWPSFAASRKTISEILRYQ